MKIYKVEFNQYTYDQYDAFIVRGKDEESALNLLKLEHKPDNSYPDCDWKNGYKITEVLVEGDEEVILESYNAG